MSSQYPLLKTEDPIAAINYLLSGPGGLGQLFKGFSSSDTAYVTGNYRTPFSQSNLANFHVAPINLATSQMLDNRTIKFTYAIVQSTPPFALGNTVSVSGVANDFYNGSYTPIGVVESSYGYCIVRLNNEYPLELSSAGGTISLDAQSSNFHDPYFLSTDCNAKIQIQGATDRVFISAQLNALMNYVATYDSVLEYTVSVNRYSGYPNNNPVNPDYFFLFDKTIATRTYRLRCPAGTDSVPPTPPVTDYLIDAPYIDTVFASAIDNPGLGYYWYILEVAFAVNSGESTYVGDDSTTSFPVTSGNTDMSNVVVYLQNIDTGEWIEQYDPDEYSISGTSIVFVKAPPVGYRVVIYQINGYITSCETGQRSLTAQVVKE